MKQFLYKEGYLQSVFLGLGLAPKTQAKTRVLCFFLIGGKGRNQGVLSAEPKERMAHDSVTRCSRAIAKVLAII
jgi:hypothetical protein